MTVWDPKTYVRFAADRDRPARDLIARLPEDLDPQEVWDLGCGTGAHAVLFADRWPRARVAGLDTSAEMLEAARRDSDRVDWRLGSIDAFAPERPADLLFSNAALQWLPDHEALLPRLLGALSKGGVFAMQAPLSFEAPQHALLRETAQDGPWADRLCAVEGVRPLLPPERYYDLAAPAAETVDLWTTTYLHVLEGPDPVLAWMSGTGARPFLQALADPDERAAFTEAYRSRLSAAFPRRADGTTLMPFPRLFLVCRRRR